MIFWLLLDSVAVLLIVGLAMEVESIQRFRKLTAKLKPSEIKLRRLPFVFFWELVAWSRVARRNWSNRRSNDLGSKG